MSVATLDEVRRLLWERDCFDLVEALDGAQLEVWTQPHWELGLLDEDFPHWYPLTCAEVTTPWWAEEFDRAFDALHGAVAEVIGSAVDFRIVQGDWPLEVYEPAPAPAPQAIPSEWDGMHFRSKAERAIAEALDRASVAFFPNARGRVGTNQDSRYTREPDFIVCAHGQWGILEVDGPRHEGKAAEDHERLRLFKHHGIRVGEPFDAERCRDMPGDVVAEFLQLLRLNG